jgi:hypothetical protein
MEFDSTLTALGKQRESEMPCRARKIMSWMPVCKNPVINVRNIKAAEPRRKSGRAPRISAMDPERRRVLPQARLLIFQYEEYWQGDNILRED